MITRRIRLILILVTSFLICYEQINAGIFYKEINAISGYSDIDGWVGKKGMALKNSIGFEYFGKASNEYGDYLTYDLQMRLAYDPSEDFDNALAVEIHNAYLEYKLGLGSKLIFGHFSPAFGLEPIIDTHATLLQTLAPANIGFKKDWGISYKGFLGEFDYQIAAQLGSGMSIHSKDDNFLITARIGTPQNRDFQYGFSLLYGEVLQSKEAKTIPRAELVSDKAVLKRRVGLDAQYLTGPYLLKGEVAYGKDDDRDVMGALIELDYTVPANQNLELALQGQFWSRNLDSSGANDLTLAFCVSYKLTSNITIRTAYFQDVYSADGREDRQAFLQIYYYGS